MFIMIALSQCNNLVILHLKRFACLTGLNLNVRTAWTVVLIMCYLGQHIYSFQMEKKGTLLCISYFRILPNGNIVAFSFDS